MENVQSINYACYENKKDLFSCSLGRIIDDKLILFRPRNYEIILDDIAFVEFKKTKETKLNVTVGVIGVLISLYGVLFLNADDGLIPLVGMLIATLALFIKTETAFIHIILKDPKQIVIKLERKEQKKGQIFVKKVNQFKNSRIVAI
jgi:hypothetical protein